MKKIIKLAAAIGIMFYLSACAMSSQSPDGENCNYAKFDREGLASWQWPLLCQPQGG